MPVHGTVRDIATVLWPPRYGTTALLTGLFVKDNAFIKREMVIHYGRITLVQ